MEANWRENTEQLIRCEECKLAVVNDGLHEEKCILEVLQMVCLCIYITVNVYYVKTCCLEKRGENVKHAENII